MSFLQKKVKFCITFRCYETLSPKPLYALDKSCPLKCRSSHFWLLAWKISKFLMSFFKTGVSFSYDFPSPFIVMIHNSSKILYLKHYMILTKRIHQYTIFQTLGALVKVHPICHAVVETKRSGFIQILYHCISVMKDNFSVFATSNFIYFGHWWYT